MGCLGESSQSACWWGRQRVGALEGPPHRRRWGGGTRSRSPALARLRPQSSLQVWRSPRWPKSLLQHHSSKALIFQHSAFFIVQLSHSYMTTGKTIALTRQTFVVKVMSLLFNILSGLTIAFLPRSKCLLITWLQSPSAVILEPKKGKVCHCFHYFPIYLPWSDGTRCLDLSSLNVEL